MELVIAYLPFLCAVLVLGAFLWMMNRLLIGRHAELGNERQFPRQLIMLGLILVSLLILILTLPIDASSRNQLIGLIGLMVSGMIAFSSTNITANFMAGILLRITKPFWIGDFIRVEEHFGRVSERGLFDTEIQTEYRELIAVPNTYFINHPVTTTRSSGVIISAKLSLGFDVHHTVIESLLVKAAEQSGLEEPFVHIMELGDFSVTYRVAGWVIDIKKHITARSHLYRCILDVLHAHNIEILSPRYVTQQRMDNHEKVIPPKVTNPDITAETEDNHAESLAFDKAEQAEQVAQEKQLVKEIKELEVALKEASEADKASIKDAIAHHKEQLKILEQNMFELHQETSESNRRPDKIMSSD